MRVMIVDDDPWLADLLKQIVLSARPEAQVDCLESAQSAADAFGLHDYRLVLSDWNLPDGAGIDLLRQIRKRNAEIPLVMITGRSDRESVLQVRPLGVSAYITKPFDIPRVLACIEQILPKGEPTTLIAPQEDDFLAHLNQLSPADLDLPLLSGVRDRLALALQGVPLDFRELAEHWQQDAALCAYLIAAANSAFYGGAGQPCNSLAEALRRLGGKTSLNLAVALALRQACEEQDPLLGLLLQEHLAAAERLAEQVVALARQCGVEHGPLQTAALLHRLGELCVLLQARQWAARNHSTLDDALLNRAIGEYARPFAVELKAHWRLPMALRHLIGAVYALPQAQMRREQVLMRLAAALCQDEPAETIDRLRSLAGIG